MYDDKREFEKKCVKHEKLKKDVHKGLDVNLPEHIGTESDLIYYILHQ